MKSINIAINKADVFEAVSLNADYSSTNVDDLKRISTLDVDKDILTRFWKETGGNISEKLKTFISIISFSEDIINVVLEVSNAYDDTLTSSVETDLYAAIVAGITAKWFSFTLRDLHQEWEEQMEKLFNRIISKLCYRKRPVRP